MSNIEDFIAISDAEKLYNLPRDTIRRDIHRKRFAEDEYMKIGRNWIIKRSVVERVYKKAPNQ